MAGDVLSIPFPPITQPLLASRPLTAPLSRSRPAMWTLYFSRTLSGPAGRTLQLEVLGPSGLRWWRQLRRAMRDGARPAGPAGLSPHPPSACPGNGPSPPSAGPGNGPYPSPARAGISPGSLPRSANLPPVEALLAATPAWRWFVLAFEALWALPRPDPQSLWSVEYLREQWARSGVLPYPHQLDTARRVLFEMGGRAVLADEVGLGKTVEAGLILHEMLLRHLVRRALILVPAGLMWQWYRELREKFDLPVELQASERDWLRVALLIASLETAKRPPHRQHVLAQPYDLVIVDEAHRLKNHRTSAFQLVAALQSRYLLLLTATPVHNSLRELHALFYLVAPESVGELADFCRRFGARGRHADDPAGLRQLVRRHIVRHRRRSTAIPFTRREVHTRPVELTPGERAFYDALDQLAPARRFGQAAQAAQASREKPGLPTVPALLWLTLKREACSSPYAACATLRRLATRLGAPALEALARQGEALEPWAKAQAVAELVQELGDEHVLVFTEYSATQQAMAEQLAQLGRPVVLFHGSLSPMQREWAQAVFRERAPIMVCTDAGAEGVNLQFCRHLINVDLPWNPMRLEQRIGRLHRLGQTRDVHIWNIYARHTVDEYVLYLLHDKLNLFRSVVGELEDILEPLGGPPAFEQALVRALAGDDGEPKLSVEQALEELVRQWNAALKRYQARMRLQQQLLDAD